MLHALFGSAIRQQLQSPPGARAAWHSVQLVEIDILKGESRTPEFLAKNPNGQIPLLEVAPGRYLVRVERHPLVRRRRHARSRPTTASHRAEALQWMFFEQHSLEPNIGAAYFWLALIKGGRDLQQHALEDWMENGYRALGVMEMHLARYRFFVADHFTIADIALYAYTHLAHRCDFDLAPLSRRCAAGSRASTAEPGHVKMDWQPQPLAAAE